MLVLVFGAYRLFVFRVGVMFWMVEVLDSYWVLVFIVG